jgi:hypothetical protein
VTWPDDAFEAARIEPRARSHWRRRDARSQGLDIAVAGLRDDIQDALGIAERTQAVELNRDQVGNCSLGVPLGVLRLASVFTDALPGFAFESVGSIATLTNTTDRNSGWRRFYKRLQSAVKSRGAGTLDSGPGVGEQSRAEVPTRQSRAALTPARIQDAARRWPTSPACGRLGLLTVSRAPRRLAAGDRGDARRRIKQMVGDTGYRDQSRGGGLRLQRSRQILVMLPTIANPFFGEIVLGVEEEAQRRGFGVLVGNTSDTPSARMALGATCDPAPSTGWCCSPARMPALLAASLRSKTR